MNLGTLSCLVAAALLVYLLHRLALWLESRGWLYYINRKPPRPSLGNAFLELGMMIEPETKHLLEIRREEKSELAESGDPPSPDELPSAEA